ncbi:MAG: TonB-dependent receptor [Acidobacteriota bacterium]|nr:TonB-dependent receptor [Acidobacteriota bacterium]
MARPFETGLSWTKIVFCALSICPIAMLGQSGAGTGRIEGTAFDASGAVVPGAEVAIQNEETGVSTKITSEANGHFLALYLAPGPYSVSIAKQGFAAVRIPHVQVNVGTTSSFQPRLQPGNVSVTLTVDDQVPLVDPAQSAFSSVVGKLQIEALPLNGRNFTDFVLLTPGATTDGDFGMVSFNGVAGNFNNYMVDGANNNNAFFSQQIGRTSIPYQFSEDVVQEFQVTSTGYEAEFGQAGGGVVNTVTKSGGNQTHGDGYYYILDSALDANDAIDNENGIPKPDNRRQQFGGTVGGPIVHDRLFYLGNYEGQLRNEPITINDQPALVGLPPGFFSDHPDLQSAVASAAGSFPRTFNQNTGFAKLSGLLTPRNSFSATYNYQRFRSPHGYFNTPTSTGDGLSLTDGATSQFFQFSVISSISPTFVNEARFHLGKDYHFDLPRSAAAEATTTIQNPDSGFVFGGNRFQLSTSDDRYQFADNVTKILGRHSIRFGVDINVNHDTDYFLYGPKGEYRFASLADVPTGNFELYLQAFGQPTTVLTSPTYSMFVQDEFHVTSRLNVNYGLRYDLQVLPQPGACNTQFELTCKIPYSKKNLSPRFGFAYSLDSAAKTVVRGGFGIFYIQADLLDVSQALGSNGISRPFLVTTGPAFGNDSPLVTYPNSLSSFPTGSGGSPSLVVFAPNFRSPYVEQANVALEHQFGGHMTASLGYVYSHGLALLGNSNGVTRQANGNFGLDLNLVPPDQQPVFGGNFSTATVTLPDGKSFVVPEFEAIDGYRNPNFGAINAVDNSGKSIYHGLLASWRYVSPQFSAGIAYTFSRTTDQGTGYFNQFDQASQRGPSQLDQPQRFVLNEVWTPAWQPLRNFSFSSIVTLASGRPYTAVFDTSSVNFSVVPGEPFNGFRGPDAKVVDFSVARLFKISERLNIKILAEAFNLLNHPNFQQSPVDNVQYTTTQATDAVGNNLPVWAAAANPQFGSPLAIAPRVGSRNLQLSARFSF